MNYLRLFPFLFIFIGLVGCADDDLMEIPIESDLETKLVALYGSKDALIMPIGNLGQIPQDPKNVLTPEKVRLGQMLFHETGIAMDAKVEEGMGTYSCASCHQVKAGFQSGIRQGLGEGGLGFGSFGEARRANPAYDVTDIDFQPIRSPSAMNLAYQKVMLWNGQFGATGPNAGTESKWTPDTPKATNQLGFEGLETQAIAGMDVHRLKCTPDMIIGTPYQPYFDAAYPDMDTEERYSKIAAALAIAAYERTLLASEAPFQKWLRGDENAMDQEEKAGAELFFGKAKCYTCHNGPGLNGMDFHALGMADLEGADILGDLDMATSLGRAGFTGNPSDNFKFKTPQLYNLRDARFYGHGASFTAIEDVIRYKNEAIPQNEKVHTAFLSDEFTPLGLSETEIKQLARFINDGLYDPDLARYVPTELPSGNCFPVADNEAKAQMGCE